MTPENSNRRTPLSRRAARLGDSVGTGAFVGVLVSFSYEEITGRDMPETVAIAAGIVLCSVVMAVRSDVRALFGALLGAIGRRRERRTRKG